MPITDLPLTVRCPECGRFQGRRCAGGGFCVGRWRALREFEARAMAWGRPAPRSRRRRQEREWVPLFPHYSDEDSGK